MDDVADATAITLMRLALFRRVRGWRRPKAAVLRQSFLCMGTVMTISMASDRPLPEAEDALRRVRQQLDLFAQDWWAWGSGALGRCNRALAAGAAVQVPPCLRALFARAWSLHELSGGRFDPRIGALVRLWGFDDVSRIRRVPPDPQAIAALRAALQAAPPYVEGQPYGPVQKLQWDFGGIAKGWAADAALQQLAALGFPDATFDAGGNVSVQGQRFGASWRVGIRDPDSDADAPRLLASLEARNEAVNTHGDDQRSFIYAGRRYGHLLDPRSGWPAQGLRSLTVVHPEAAVAEALGAALFISGPQQWPALARSWGLEQVLAVRSSGELQVTAALAARLRLTRGLRVSLV